MGPSVINFGASVSKGSMSRNLLLLRGDDLNRGKKIGLVYEEGVLSLAQGETKGTLESPELSLPTFTELVASWNASTPPGAYVELSVRVRTGGLWSRWFTYGKWADNGANGGSVKGQADETARLDVDLLRLLSRPADTLRFKLDLFREDPGLPGPRVRLIAFTYAPKVHSPRPYTHVDIALRVPPRAQLSVPSIGNVICSPVSLATVMAYHGHIEEIEQTSAGVKDNGEGIYGNWSYNVAYAAERGFTAWVQRCNSLEDVKQYLLQGLPVIASIRTAAKEDLPGANMAYTSGHLLVVTGLLVQDGKPYVLVNDPAAHRDEDVQRQYPLERFLKAWTRKMIYVLQK